LETALETKHTVSIAAFVVRLQALAGLTMKTGPEGSFYYPTWRRIETTPELPNKKANLYMIARANEFLTGSLFTNTCLWLLGLF
jgi:hypothetical protein